MRKFDYSFLNNGLLPAGLVNLTASIASLKTMAGVRKDDYANVLPSLKLSPRYSLSKAQTPSRALLPQTTE